MIEYMPYSPQEKLKIIKYSFKHGIHSTLEAISLDLNRKLSKATLCRWRKLWKTSVEDNYGVGRLDSLKDKSKKPKVYRQPKTNKEYTNFKQWDLLQKIQEFNRNLMDWLIFYNFKRPHLGLKKDVEAVYCTYAIFKTISSNVSICWWRGTFF